MAIKVNRRIRDVVGSTTLAITARAKELKAQGHDVVNFAAGEPDFDTPADIKQAGIQAIEGGQTKYTPSIGTLELRQAIAKKFHDENGLEYAPDQIVVSCGAKHALFNIVQVLADEGDEVLIPSPYWVSYPEMVKVAGATPKILPTSAKTAFKITPGQLEAGLTAKSRLLILNSPSNPTGSVYSKEELSAIAAVCVKHGLFVLSDEIYEKLVYGAEDYTSIAALGRDIYDLTVTVNGVSKAYAMTGWRIGYAAGPKEVMGYVKKLQDHSTSNPASISQAAALQALRSSPQAVDAMRREFQIRRDLMLSAAEKIPGLRPIRPEGAFYMFCDVSALGDDFEVAQQILNDVKVAIIPGQGFGAPGFARFSFATSQERIREGTRRIAQWARTHASA